jgi:hypothetical protein
MSKHFNVLSPSIKFQFKSFGVLDIVSILHLRDIQNAKDLPNFRFEVANEASGERGVYLLRIENSKFDSDKHDFGILSGQIETWLRDLCRASGENSVPVAHSRLQYYDRSMMMRSPMDRPAEPTTDELFSVNAKNILALADVRRKDFLAYGYGGYVGAGSMIQADTDKEDRLFYRFMLHLDGGIVFHAAPQDKVENEGLSGVPFSAVANVHPSERDAYMQETRKSQGVFQFQGREHNFIFTHPLFGATLSSFIKPQVLERALNEGLRKQFPFFQVQGMDLGASMLVLKFN